LRQSRRCLFQAFVGYENLGILELVTSADEGCIEVARLPRSSRPSSGVWGIGSYDFRHPVDRGVHLKRWHQLDTFAVAESQDGVIGQGPHQFNGTAESAHL